MNTEGKVEYWLRDYAQFRPEQWPLIERYLAAHASSVAPPRGEKRPIARPCSACGDGDTEMKYHDHFPPFADALGTPSVAEAPAPDEDELYSRHMAELEANWHVHPIPPEDREWINGYKQGWLRHRMRFAPAPSESEETPRTWVCEGCGISSNERYLPSGWEQFGKSKRRIPGKRIGLAAWCPRCKAKSEEK